MARCHQWPGPVLRGGKNEDLKIAFRKIIEQISVSAEKARGRVAASGSSRVASDVGIFESFYDAGQSWLGGVMAQVLKKDGNYEDAWGGKSTAELLDDKYPASADARTIISTNSTSPFSGQGIPFRFASLSQSQQGDLNGDADMVNYLRGDRDKEGTRTSSVQGDIVNATVWYMQGAVSNYNFADYTSNKYLDFARDKQNRPAMIYVGGNDGMLHGFDAGTGEEKIAYVPNGVYPHLADLASTGYAHHYFVDGPGMTGDIYDGGGWKTVFVGALGAGAKGYYVLDVTDPGSFSEGNAARLVLLDGSFSANFDCTAGCDVQDDIGHIFAGPAVDGSNVLRALQIARLNDGRWAAILGNGLNSKNGNSVLLIQYLDGNREVLRVPAAASAGKTGGLGGPMPVDINGDGRPDVVYAGDNDGKLWKFDISSPDPGQWKVAFGGEPLFSLPAGPDPAASGHPNPITAAPLVRPAPGSVPDPQNPAAASIKLGGMMVAFGTGRNVTADDRSDKTVQGIYSVLDNTRYKAKPHPRGLGQVVEICTSTSDTECNITQEQVPAIVGKAQLAKQSFAAPNAGGDHWKVDQGVKIDWSTQKGWFLELPEAGERLLQPIRPYENSRILSIFTQVPAQGGGGGGGSTEESCDVQSVTAGKQFQTMLHIASGQAARQPLFDADAPSGYGTEDEGYAHRILDGSPVDLVLIKGPEAVEVAAPPGGAGTTIGAINLLGSKPVRPSWRQTR